jgi:hypothetical protein
VGLHPDAAFVEQLVQLRRTRQLHGRVAARLAELLAKLNSEAVAVPEVGGVLGGRNDLIQFSFNGRRVVFEIFATPSQVPQDLRLLEQAKADVKIAVLLDQEADEKLARAYFRKKPDAFPYLWVSRVLRPEVERITLAQLSEIADESATVARFRRLLVHPAGQSLDRAFREQLAKIEAALGVSQPAPPAKLNGRRTLALKVVAAVDELGMPVEHLRSLYAWLELAIDFGVELVTVGMQAYLITDLKDYRAIWSADDLADRIFWLRGCERPHIVMDLTELITTTLKDWGVKVRPQQFHFIHAYAEMARLVPLGAQNKMPKKKKSQVGTGKPKRGRRRQGQS